MEIEVLVLVLVYIEMDNYEKFSLSVGSWE